MFSRSFTSKDRAGKSIRPTKKASFGSSARRLQLLETLDSRRYDPASSSGAHARSRTRSRQFGDVDDGRSFPTSAASNGTSGSPVVTIVVGHEQRLFAAHEDVLCRSPFFAQACRDQFFEANGKRIWLVDEVAETFSCLLEYLYKGDYHPRLYRDKRQGSHWHLEDMGDDGNRASTGYSEGESTTREPTIFHPTVGNYILRDTAVYCAAERYGGLDELKKLALRKQGLQMGIDVGTVLRSARFAYDNTPDNDSRLRAHYLALIIRSRKTFKRSGTMQTEMETGGRMFFDLFVAMCNHMDDLSSSAFGTPKTI